MKAKAKKITSTSTKNTNKQQEVDDLRSVSAEYSEVGDASSSRPSFVASVSKPRSDLVFLAVCLNDTASKAAFVCACSLAAHF